MSSINKIRVNNVTYDVGKPVDSDFSTTSTNSIQNKKVTERFNANEGVIGNLLVNGVLNRFQLDSKQIQDAYTMELTQTGQSSFYLNGTCSASEQWQLQIGTITLPAGTWRMNSSISGGQNNLYFYCGEDTSWRTNSSVSTSTAIKTTTETQTFTIYLYIKGGFTVNQELKLCISDNEEYNLANPNPLTVLQQYAAPCPKLTEGLAELIDTGAKNLIDLSKATIVNGSSNISYTVNSDCSVTVNWNLSSTSTLRFNGLPHIDGKMVLTGCPVGGGTSTYLMQIRQGDTTISGTGDTGTGSSEFELPSGTFDIVLRLASGTYTKTFYPMICRKIAWDISKKYVPYCPSLKELYAMIGNINTVLEEVL